MGSYLVETKGIVTESLPNALFRVQLDNGSQILGDTSRKMRKNYIPVSMGDRVEVAMTSYESTRGCITRCLPVKREVTA